MLAGLHHVGTRATIAPAGIEPATSGFKVRRPSPEDSLRSSSDPCLAFARQDASGDSGAARRCRSPCTGMEQGFLVRSARMDPLVRPGGRNERRSNRREHHRPFQPTAGGRNGRWMNAGGNPVFPRPGRVVRVGARLCGCGSPDIAGARRILVFDAEPAILVRSLHTLTL